MCWQVLAVAKRLPVREDQGMKPAPFTWHEPHTVAEAVDILATVEAGGHGGKVLAGGQSLIPVLAMRLAEPAHLVDINAIEGLDSVEVTDAGVRIGALVRHNQLLGHAGAARVQPLLGRALASVAHATIRNRGTTVGSLAHGDPAGEMTAVLALTGGSVKAASVRGERDIDAADFFVGPLESSLEPDELAVSAFFPASPPGSSSAFVEMARRHGDYALAGVAAVVTPASDTGSARDDAADGAADSGFSSDSGAAPHAGTATVRCGLLSVADTPLVLDLTEAWASGAEETAAAVREAIDPEDDIHASAGYRRHLAGVLTVRAIGQACDAEGQVAA
jgi:carbon-monoxide dehydrogenase medium subunit